VFVGANSGRHTITGNNFSNSHLGGGKDKRPAEHKTAMGRDEATGILLQSTSDIVISGNQFSGLSGSAVTGEGALKRLVITGNLVTDYGRRVTPKPQAIALGTPSSSIIKDNVVE
jgi:hypothetical protein